MNKIKFLLYNLFGIYCLIPFVLSFIVVIPIYFLLFSIGGPDAPYRAHRVSRAWAWFLFSSFFIRVKINNREVIDPKKEYVFVANHLSVLDIPLYAVSCENTFRFLSKAELAKIPFLGYVIRKLYITVNRSDKTDRGRSIEKMKESLREGISVFLAPEGTRNKTSAPLLAFKDGAFILAVQSGIPLAVLTVINTHHLLSPAHPLALKPGTLRAEWSEPILTAGMTEKDIPILKEMVRNKMLTILKK
jgi:1-acyl-sn-glycerol-3-phosphate acyltransferase